MQSLFGGSYDGTRVFVTGHTGFKGSWLCAWLERMGALTWGYSLAQSTTPCHAGLLGTQLTETIGDLRDAAKLAAAVAQSQPSIVFHLAAQPIVRASYADPRTTYETNVIGTLNLCEACRQTSSVRAIVLITTDKVYRNNEWVWAYREVDALGGHDPYSSSKACAEILAASYRDSFFPVARYPHDHQVLLATARAGNVIGGGDWAADRLLPDLMRAAGNGDTARIRNPSAVRPWQHVLDCLSGYLLLGSHLLAGRSDRATCYNFGPAIEEDRAVGDIAERVAACWPRTRITIDPPSQAPHEAGRLRLDSSRARADLGWAPVWNTQDAIDRTVAWYREYYESNRVVTLSDIHAYTRSAAAQGAPWAAVS